MPVKSLLLLFGCCLLLGTSCQRTPNDPQPNPAELIIGKWKLVKVDGFNTLTGKLESEVRTEPDYRLFEFTKDELLYSYQLSESSQKQDCAHAGSYRVGNYQKADHFTLENQVYIVFDGCSVGKDPSHISVRGFRVSQNELIMETDRLTSPINYTFTYTRLP